MTAGLLAVVIVAHAHLRSDASTKLPRYFMPLPHFRHAREDSQESNKLHARKNALNTSHVSVSEFKGSVRRLQNEYSEFECPNLTRVLPMREWVAATAVVGNEKYIGEAAARWKQAQELHVPAVFVASDLTIYASLRRYGVRAAYCPQYTPDEAADDVDPGWCHDWRTAMFVKVGAMRDILNHRQHVVMMDMDHEFTDKTVGVVEKMLHSKEDAFVSRFGDNQFYNFGFVVLRCTDANRVLAEKLAQNTETNWDQAEFNYLMQDAQREGSYTCRFFDLAKTESSMLESHAPRRCGLQDRYAIQDERHPECAPLEADSYRSLPSS